ncbi:Serine/threonine-protein kinase CTR1 [Auxenochlorella protothecoides]|uniref:Serine/threonine-protein kinase CTR1 n=1 Tax=Auxenochlorella protothecoides TaxID=3075 RepID=A0A087SI96_AUXPR|nr:Serine/threonine-protein kinase CTR1 [Auxenochlorella protothecoides]KFM25450.1 Serine/threonine-protein kinase CTR1 [Auxenochlorella protothecoides]
MGLCLSTANPTHEQEAGPPVPGALVPRDSLFKTRAYDDEPARVSELRSLQIPYTKQDERFDQITRLMSTIFQVPLSMITLIDSERMSFLSAAGNGSAPRCEGFCEFVLVPAHPVAHIVEDTLRDARFMGHENVASSPHIRFYAGAPLVGSRGFRYGTLCVSDYRPRRFPAELYNTLVNFADLVVREIERPLPLPSPGVAPLPRPDLARRDAVALLDTSQAGRWVVKYVNEAWVGTLGGRPEAWLDAALQDACVVECGGGGPEAALERGEALGVALRCARGPAGAAPFAASLRPASRDRLLRSNTTCIPSFVRSLGGEAGPAARPRLPLWFLVFDPEDAAASGPAHRAAAGAGAAPAGPGALAEPRPADLADRLTLGAPLGAGSFGRVYRGALQGRPVAVKVLPVSDEASRALGLAEAAVGRRLDHPALVRTLECSVAEGAGEADPSVWIVQEFCDGGTLYDAIDRGWLRQGYDGFAPADVRAVLRTLCEVASALAHLHALGVVHGDLTGSNVLLCSAARAPDDGRGWHAKVSDFGLARELPAGGVLSNVRIYGTVSHMPPEVLMSGHLTLSADVYALGVLLYEMYEGARAWKGMRASQVLYQVATQGRGLEPSPWAQGDALGADVQALMRECLAPSPRARPSARQVLARSEALLRGMSAGGVEPLPEAVPPLAAHQTDPDFQLDWTPCLASMPDQVEAAEDPNVLAVAA